jgi:hypothetical protein
MRNPAATIQSRGEISFALPARARTMTQLMKPTPMPFAME